MAPPSSSHALSSAVESRLDRTVMVPLFAIVSVDAMGVGVVLPLLPFYAEHFGAGALTVGILFAAFSLCQFIASPILGRWSDVYGRRRILAISQIGTFASLVMLASAPTLSVVFLARILDGITAGNMSIAIAMAADRSTPATRKQAIGVVSAAMGVGLMIGPGLSAFVAGMSLAAPIWVASALSAASVVATLMFLPKGVAASPGPAAGKPRGSAFRAVLGMPRVLPVFAILAAFYLAFAMFTSEFAIVAHARVFWGGRPIGPQEIGVAFTVAGAVNVLVQLFAMRRVSSILSDHVLAVLSLASLTIGFLLLGFAHSPVSLAVAVLFVAMGSAFSRPVLMATLTTAGPLGGQGALLGVNGSLMAAGNVVGPIIAGLLVNHALISGWSLAMAALCATAAMTVAVMVRVGRWPRHRSADTTPASLPPGGIAEGGPA